MQVLLVEDNADLVGNLFDFLEPRGHVVDVAYEGHAGLRFAMEGSYDVIVLDLSLPGLDGFEVCRQLRDAGRSTPVLMLTARESIEDKLEGFSVGADDYLVKPFALLELEARLESLTRRALGGNRRGVLEVGPLSLDTDSYRLSRDGQSLSLAKIPMQIVELLMRQSPKVVSREEIERRIWGANQPNSDVLKAHIYAVRAAIDKPFETPLLETIKGVGFRLSASDA